MGLSVCPAATVAAPVERVWELLSEPTLYDEWWDARTERITPEGKAAPGQMLYAKTSALGRQWDVTLRVEAVNPEKHQIQLNIGLPLGSVNHATITCHALDAATSRVQFG
ncbi:MAG TPA: SRPBCC family protein [Ktedonobacterales bacterium]